jgi:hypothetical protein
MSNQEDYVIIWEAPKLEPAEYRLYYDDTGKVICYCGDKSVSGDNYIIIDAHVFAEARPDLRVINGKISTVPSHAIVQKLIPNDNEGAICHQEDISIIVESTEKHVKWKLKTYEL